MFCETSVEKFAYADRTEVHSNCDRSDIDVLYRRQLDVFIMLFQDHQFNLTEKVTETGSLKLERAVVAECAIYRTFNQETGYREMKNHMSRVFTVFLSGNKYTR